MSAVLQYTTNFHTIPNCIHVPIRTMSFAPRDTSVVDGGRKRRHNNNLSGNDSACGRNNSDVYQHVQSTHSKQMFSPSSSTDKTKQNKYR